MHKTLFRLNKFFSITGLGAAGAPQVAVGAELHGCAGLPGPHPAPAARPAAPPGLGAPAHEDRDHYRPGRHSHPVPGCLSQPAGRQQHPHRPPQRQPGGRQRRSAPRCFRHLRRLGNPPRLAATADSGRCRNGGGGGERDFNAGGPPVPTDPDPCRVGRAGPGVWPDAGQSARLSHRSACGDVVRRCRRPSVA